VFVPVSGSVLVSVSGPRLDRGPIDCRNIKGIIVDKSVNGYKIGTTVEVISGLLSRNQIEKIHGQSFLLLGSVVQIGLFS
jgi:hypothetical protein